MLSVTLTSVAGLLVAGLMLPDTVRAKILKYVTCPEDQLTLMRGVDVASNYEGTYVYDVGEFHLVIRQARL